MIILWSLHFWYLRIFQYSKSACLACATSGAPSCWPELCSRCPGAWSHQDCLYSDDGNDGFMNQLVVSNGKNVQKKMFPEEHHEKEWLLKQTMTRVGCFCHWRANWKWIQNHHSTSLLTLCLRPIPTSCKSDFTGLPATLMAPTMARDSTLAQAQAACHSDISLI